MFGVGGCVVLGWWLYSLGLVAVVLLTCQWLYRALMGEKDVLMGGIPVILCGDNHQLAGPGMGSWYKAMVLQAAGERREDRDPKSASSMGLLALKQAELIVLNRNMRVIGDDSRQFAQWQQDMRRTGHPTPVPAALVDTMRVLGNADVQRDATWAFAPVGCLAHVERDTVNYSQVALIQIVCFRLSQQFRFLVDWTPQVGLVVCGGCSS